MANISVKQVCCSGNSGSRVRVSKRVSAKGRWLNPNLGAAPGSDRPAGCCGAVRLTANQGKIGLIMATGPHGHPCCRSPQSGLTAVVATHVSCIMRACNSKMAYYPPPSPERGSGQARSWNKQGAENGDGVGSLKSKATVATRQTGPATQVCTNSQASAGQERQPGGLVLQR